MADSAATKFVQTSDLLLCLGDQIRNKAQLRSLCLVNKDFGRVFTPFLYAELQIETWLDRRRRRILYGLRDNPHLRHVRTLTCRFSHRGRVNDLMRTMFRRMPRLERFEWDGGTLFRETMVTLLRSCPRLSKVSIIHVPEEHLEPLDYSGDFLPSDSHTESDSDMYDHIEAAGPGGLVAKTAVGAVPEDDDPDEIEEGLLVDSPEFTRMRYLVPFSDLTSLMLGELDGDLIDLENHRWEGDIVKILAACPSLQELSLGLSTSCIRRTAAEMDRGGENDFPRLLGTFLKRICEGYGSTDSKPLRLRNLRLGLGVLPWADNWLPDEAGQQPLAVVETEVASYLALLTDLTALEDLHIENQDVTALDYSENVMEIDRDASQSVTYTGISWTTFAPCFAPRLRRLTAYVYDDHVRRFLKESFDAQQARKLALSFSMALGQDEFPIFRPKYPAPYQDTQLRFRVVDDYSWRMPESCVERWSLLEGLFLHMQASRDACSFAYLGFIEESLKHLPDLRQLVVGYPLLSLMNIEELYPLRPASLHERARGRPSLHERANRLEGAIGGRTGRKALARRLANAGRGLRIVKIGKLAWQVLRTEDGTVSRLLSMDKYEQRSIEIAMPPSAVDPSLWPLEYPEGFRHCEYKEYELL